MSKPLCKAEADAKFLRDEYKSPHRESPRLVRYFKRMTNRARRHELRRLARAER